MALKAELVTVASRTSAYTNGESFAIELVDRQYLLDGVDATGCSEEECPNAIEFEETNESGPESLQPQGFKCADHWVCNEHGHRAEMICNRCIALGLAD